MEALKNKILNTCSYSLGKQLNFFGKLEVSKLNFINN